jgi:flagellar biosynthetic protein FliR
VLLVRPGVLMMVAPCFGGSFLPAQVKIGLAVLLALLLAPTVTVLEIGGSGVLMLVVMREAAIGFALGLAMSAFIAAVELAGHLAGFQLGLSYSAIVDPQSGVRNNVVSVLYMNLTLVAFLLANGHHAFLRALTASYQDVPVGFGRIGPTLGDSVVALLGLVFTLGVRLAAPLVLVLLVCELAIGLISRVAPMLNLMAVAAPARLLIGLVLLGVMAPIIARTASSVIDMVLQLGVAGAQAFR